MTDQPDRIRVWNEETGEMMEPATVQEMLRTERNNGNAEGVLGTDQYPVDSNEYGHLVFMRNTGMYDFQSAILGRGIEIFDGDLVTHSIEPYVYRVVHRYGEWMAESLLPIITISRPLYRIFHPTIVGNVFENKDLVLKGEIIDE